MKKTLLLISCLGCLFGVQAQITITRSDFGSIGDKSFFAHDTTVATTVSVGAAGANQTWNFSTVLSADKYDTTAYTDPTSDPNAPVGSNLRIIAGIDTQYLQVNTNYARMMVNAPSPLSGILKLDILRFPTNYQSEFYDSTFLSSSGPASLYGLPAFLDSAAIFGRIDAHITCDGWGTLTTPGGSFSTLRLFNSVVSQFVVYGRVALTSQWNLIAYQVKPDYSYSWLANGQKDIVAEAKIDTASHITKFRYKVSSIPSSVALNPQTSDLQLYPNPVTSNLNLEFALPHNSDAIITISDVQGREVYSEKRLLNEGNQKIQLNTSQLPPGFYLCQVKGKNLQLNRKFTVSSR